MDLRRVLPLLAVTLGIPMDVPAAYPDRPVRYVLPSAAGGGPDVAARIVMAELGRQIGQQVIVDNRPGGSGTIGTGGTPEQFAAHIRKEAARWADVVKRSGAKVD